MYVSFDKFILIFGVQKNKKNHLELNFLVFLGFELQ